MAIYGIKYVIGLTLYHQLGNADFSQTHYITSTFSCNQSRRDWRLVIFDDTNYDAISIASPTSAHLLGSYTLYTHSELRLTMFRHLVRHLLFCGKSLWILLTLESSSISTLLRLAITYHHNYVGNWLLNLAVTYLLTYSMEQSPSWEANK
jgi:hypothetical protein